MEEKKRVGRPPRKIKEVIPEGPCVICKRITRETADFGDKQLFIHQHDCTGPTF